MQTIWGSDCGRVKIIGNRIRTVNAKNGEKSELYDSILDHIKDLPKEDLEALQEQYKSWEGKYIHTTDDLKHLALAMYAQTTSENFKKWFQDSKVVDKNGEPILIYHGTNKTFDSFNLDKEGVSYFTPNIDRGKLYGNNIYPVFLNISDPLIQNNKNFENLTRPEAIKIAKINNDGLIIEMNKGNTYLIFSNNQVKSLFNKGEYKKENPNIYQQQSGNTVSSKASPETIGRYKEWAKRAGFDLDDTLSHLTDEKGNKLDANGRVDLLRKAIQIVSGKSDIAVGEEVSHGIVSIIKQTNPALFKEMMNSVGKYDLYSKVVAEYGSDSNYQIDGKPNIPKLKEETLGKILNELIINRLEGSTEKPELLQRTQTFWDKIKSFFKDLLSKIGFDPTSDPIDKAAKEFTEGKIQNPVKDLTDKKKDETYQDFKKRTLDEIQSIADVVPDKTAIITHGTVIGLLKGIDKGKETTSSQVDNGEIYTKEINGKTLYFVRHGQSEANITKEDATPETPLTQKGKEDAKNTAQKLKDLGVTNVFSTDTTRTKDTASIIRNILNPTIENKFNSLLPQEKINYQLKVTKALQSLSAKNLFDRFYNTGNKEKFYNELLQLGATKDQVNLLKELNEIEDPKSIEDMWTNVMAQLSYTVTINTAKSNNTGKSYSAFEGGYSEDRFEYNGDKYTYDSDDGFFTKNNQEISFSEFGDAKRAMEASGGTPTQHYSNLTVPGGTNYTENEIATPGIVPSIKGHAQFSTDNGIGWFRSDDRQVSGIENGRPVIDRRLPVRRILEVQSDLFQKGRDKTDLIGDISYYEEGVGMMQNLNENAPNEQQNKFLQLLNKDGNWIPFFIKSIIQDSAKKGYEHVLFPTGDTASKVEGHETLEEFKRQKQSQIDGLRYRLRKPDTLREYKNGFAVFKEDERISKEMGSRKEAGEFIEALIRRDNAEIAALEDELKRTETEGFAALKPIYDFYENRVKNTLVKTYGKENIERIKDEYGNEWYQVNIDQQREGNNILLQRTNQEKDKEEQTFLQKSKEENDKEEQESLYNKINTKSSVELKDKDKEDSHYEDTVTGKKVNRVTDRAKKFLKNLFKTKGKETEGDKAIQDLKKEAGTQYHAAIAHIHERAINSDGTLKIKIVNGERRVDLSDVGILPEGVDEGFYNTLQNHLYGYTDNAKVYHEGMISNPTSFPEGTKFLWEKTIYNPNSTIDGVKGEAGTVDFMAIKPDKKIDLFDWKFLGSLLENKTIMDYMKTAYDRQMSGYKAILMSDAYGVKEEDLEKSRMIPIAVQYDKNTGEVKNMSIGDADYKVEQPDYMLPYITSQEKTGNEDLDKLINSLSGIVEKLRKKSMNEMDKAISLQKIHNIEKAILHIGLMRSFDPLISQAKNFTTETFNNLQDIKKKLTTTKLNLNKKEDLIKVKNEIMSPLVEMKDDLEVYKTLGNLTTFLDKDDPERKDLEKISKDAGNLIYGVKDQNGNIKINGVKGILYEFWNQYAATRGIKDLIENQTKLASFWNELDTLSTSQLSTLHGLYDLMNIKQHIVEQESNEFLPGLLDIQKKLEEWGSFKNMLDLLYKKNYKDKQTTGQIKELIDEFDSQFYTELEKRIDAQQWHGKEGVENLIDRDKFQDWATRTREQKMEAWEHTSFLKPEDKQERKEQIERETDLSGKYAWSNYNVLKEFAKEDWHSKGFKELSKPENKAVKDLYDFIIDTNQIAAESGYIQYNKRKNSLPQITKSLAEKFSLGGQWNAVDKLLESITVSGEEQGIEVRNKVTGELIPVLPRYFIRDLSFENKEGERDYSTVSDDLVKNIGMFRYKVLDYKAKSDLQDLVEGLHYLEKYKQVKETNKSGNTTGKLLDDNSHNEKVFDDAMKQHLYDMHILSSYDAKSGKSFEVAGEKRSISAIKTADTLKSAYSFAVLGCNSVTSVFRSITTGAAALYNAGRYYTYKQVMKSYWDFCAMKGLSDYALHVELLKNFLPVEENLHLGLEKLTANSVTAIDLQDAMMKWVKSAHNIVQYVNYLAHMDNAIVINGKVMNARDYYRNTDEYKQKYSSEANRKEIDKGFDAKVQSLINDHGLLKKAKLVDGKLNIEGLDMNDFSVADLKSTIRVGGRMLSGNISENDQSHIRSNSLLRQMFLYTNWLPQAARQRLRGITYNEGMRKYEYGREHMLWDILTKGEGGIPQRCKNLINIGMGNEAGVKALNEMYHYHKDEYLKKTGKELHMDSTEFNDMIRENMKIQGRELLTLLTFAGMAMGLYALAPKKDEEGYEESIGYFTFMKRVVNRCKDELEIFYNPATFAQFGSGSKFPLLSYLSDAGTALHSIGKEGFGLATGDEESLEKVHAAVHVTNVLPIGRSIEQNLFFIDPEMYHYLFPGGTVPDEPKGGSR